MKDRSPSKPTRSNGKNTTKTNSNKVKQAVMTPKKGLVPIKKKISKTDPKEMKKKPSISKVTSVFSLHAEATDAAAAAPTPASKLPMKKKSNDQLN